MDPESDIHIGFAPLDPSHTFWAIVALGAKEWAAAQGVRLSIQSAATVTEQVEALDLFILQHVDAIILGTLWPSDQQLVAAVRRADSARIPVIAIDTGLTDCTVACVVRSDNSDGAERAASHLVTQLDGQGKVVHIQGKMDVVFGRERFQGVHTVVERHPGIQIVHEECGDWDRETGAAVMRTALAGHPDVRGVIAANDTMALGAVDAIVAAGCAHPILVAGFDALPEALRAIGKGQMLTTVRQFPRDLITTTVDIALRVIQREAVPSEVLVDVDLITIENLLDATLDAMDLLPRVLSEITRSTAEQRELQRAIIAAQNRTIYELSTPIIPISADVLVVPLIGAISTTRATQSMEAILEAIVARQAKVVIIDITGVAMVDTSVAHHLMQTTQAAQLLGTTVLVVGITPEVAQTIVQLGIDMSHIITRSTLQAGLAYVMGTADRTGTQSVLFLIQS